MLLSLALLAGCKKEPEQPKMQPDIIKIRSICELATLECYYHNVAKAIKSAGTGITHIGEKDRAFWIEYDGIVRLGVDMSQVTMSMEGNVVTVTMPPAKVLEVTVNNDSYNAHSYIVSPDNIFGNEITAADATTSVRDAQEAMKQAAEGNRTLLVNAQERAKKLIENYIRQIGDAIGLNYTVVWAYTEENK